MKFIPLNLAGAWLIELEPRCDDRGHFARAWCEDEFSAQSLCTGFVQANFGFSHRQGTVRGLHYQREPHAEVKVVRCTRGAVYDVLVDVRPDSPTFGHWHAEELTPDNGRALYIPAGFAHGYQTLTDNAEIFYQTSQAFVASAATGVPWNDAQVGIAWPLPATSISAADQNWPSLAESGQPIQRLEAHR